MLTEACRESQRLLEALVQSLQGDQQTLQSSRPHVDLGVDATIIALYASALLLFTWAFRFLVAAPVARSFLGGAAARRRNPRDFDSQVCKFIQSIVELLFYATFSVLGFHIVRSQPWVWPSANWWIGFADSGAPHALMRDDLRCFYLLYTARYAMHIAAATIEPKRRDFIEMSIHQVVTLTVCSISYWYGWNRVGVVVMFILDPADVPLHLAKLCKYTGDATHSSFSSGIWLFCADLFFFIFAVAFFIMRLVIYPYVCWSAHVEATRYFPKGVPEWLSVVLLEMLLALQVYWFSLILTVAVRVFRMQRTAEAMGTPSQKKLI